MKPQNVPCRRNSRCKGLVAGRIVVSSGRCLEVSKAGLCGQWCEMKERGKQGPARAGLFVHLTDLFFFSKSNGSHERLLNGVPWDGLLGWRCRFSEIFSAT